MFFLGKYSDPVLLGGLVKNLLKCMHGSHLATVVRNSLTQQVLGPEKHPRHLFVNGQLSQDQQVRNDKAGPGDVSWALSF